MLVVASGRAGSTVSPLPQRRPLSQLDGLPAGILKTGATPAGGGAALLPQRHPAPEPKLQTGSLPGHRSLQEGGREGCIYPVLHLLGVRRLIAPGCSLSLFFCGFIPVPTAEGGRLRACLLRACRLSRLSPAEGFTFSSHHRARISAHPCQISSQSRGNNFFCFFSPKPFGFRFSAVIDRENAVYRAKLEDFRGFTMKLKNSELVLLLGTDPVIATAIVIGVEEIPDGTRFTMRTGAKVSHYSKLHGSRGKFEISRVEREGDRWIVEGKRLGG